jgi:hypothetical protein
MRAALDWEMVVVVDDASATQAVVAVVAVTMVVAVEVVMQAAAQVRADLATTVLLM